MADVAMWQDKQVKAAFEARGRERFQALADELEGEAGVVAIEPESGDYFLGGTLGQANDAAFARYPDQWLYFVRVDTPQAAIALPTWEGAGQRNRAWRGPPPSARQGCLT
jgi:hypothetical protein